MTDTFDPINGPADPGVVLPGEAARGILDSITDAFFAVDVEWNFTYVNPEAERLLRRTKEELLGRCVWEMFPDAIGSQFDIQYRHAVRSGRPVRFEEFYEPLAAWFEVRAFPYCDGLAVYFADISDRHSTEQQRESLMAQMLALSRISRAALSTLDLGTMLDAIAFELASVMRADAAVLLLHQSDRLETAAAHGIEAESLAEFSVEIGEGFSGRIGQTREIVFIEDIKTDPLVSRPFVKEGPIRSMLGAPMVARDELVGVVHVDWFEVRAPSDDEIALLQLVADRCALAISNSRLYERSRESAALGAALNRINDALHSTLDYQTVLGLAVSEARAAMGCDSVALDVYQDGFWIPILVDGLTEEIVGMKFGPEDVPFVEEAARTQRPVFLADALNDEAASVDVQQRFGIPSVLVSPLVRRDKVIGALFFNYHSPRLFSDAAVDFSAQLANTVALAMENAELYETEHKIARTLQEALLAIPERVLGVEFGTAYRAAHTRVGGDFFDVFELDGGLVGLVIGDVAGKGLDAAVLTSVAKHSLRAYATDCASGPAEVMAKLNRTLARETPIGSFATIVYLILDTATGAVRYCNAGHVSAVVTRADRSTTFLEANSPLVGAFEESTFAEHTARLGPDDLLVLFTDGVSEARKDGELYGEGRAARVLASCDPLTPANAVECLLTGVTEFAGDSARDDVAVLAVRWLRTPDSYGT
jgi:PAS domain S-box-containing protein